MYSLALGNHLSDHLEWNLAHLMILIFIERERVAGCNPDLQHLHFCNLLATITSTERGAKNWSEGHPVGVGWYMRGHLLENLIDDQSEVVLLLAADFIPVDGPCLAHTETKNSTVSVEE